MVFERLLSSPWIILLIVWSLVWKFIALWKCGRNNQLVWYIVIAIVNTAGILEIIYLLFFRKNMNARLEHITRAPIKSRKRKK